jgi:hypothetical protein
VLQWSAVAGRPVSAHGKAAGFARAPPDRPEGQANRATRLGTSDGPRSDGRPSDAASRPPWNGGDMALRRALEMLKAGERINDELYRSTVHRLRRPEVAIWVYQPGRAPIALKPATGSFAHRGPAPA